MSGELEDRPVEC